MLLDALSSSSNKPKRKIGCEIFTEYKSVLLSLMLPEPLYLSILFSLCLSGGLNRWAKEIDKGMPRYV
jgi:hypothetical protein